MIEEFYKERNITSRTRSNYECAIKSYEKFHEMKIDDLIQEAINEEELPRRKQKLKRRLSEYRTWTINSHLSSRTAKNYLMKIKSLYRAFDCEIPELMNIKYPEDEEIDFYDIPNNKHIKQAINIADGGIKAAILFMASSGTSKTDTLQLTVKDFIDATIDYHNNGTIQEVLGELNELDNIVPLIFLKRVKTGRYYHTCCTPEASTSIVNYLLSRKNLNYDSPLFNFSVRGLSDKLQQINDKMNWGKVGKYRFFRSHSLRKFHASNLQLDEKYIHELQGRSPNPLSTTYIKVNPEVLRAKYIEHMDDVTIEKRKRVVNNEEYHIHINVMLMGSDYTINI